MNAADLLLGARESGRRLVAFPEAVRPRTKGEAYAIQDAVVSRLGSIGGWKVGAKGPSAEPTCAPLPATLILRSPQLFPAGFCKDRGVEAELAFTLARDLPARSQPYRVADVAAAIATVHPVIEIVDSRFIDLRTVDPLSLLADFNSNRALVVGDGVALPHAFESSTQRVSLDIDGARVVESKGSNPAGDVLRLVAWLAEHAAARTGALRRGDVVTTGSWTGMRFVAAGVRVHAEFANIGGVDVEFQ